MTNKGKELEEAKQDVMEVTENNTAIAAFNNNVTIDSPNNVPVSATFNGINNIALDVVNNLEYSLVVLKNLVESRVIPATSAQQALVYYLKAQELNIPFMTSMQHLYTINNKTGADVHILKGLILRSRCITWEKTASYETQLCYTDGNSKFYLSPSNIPANFAVIPVGILDAPICKELDAEARRAFKTPIWKTKDAAITVTEYKFTREIKSAVSGKVQTIVEVSRFTSLDSIQAGLGIDQAGQISLSSPHYKYPAIMQDHRAWIKGARAVGDDILCGMLSLDELYDAENISYELIDGRVIKK